MLINANQRGISSELTVRATLINPNQQLLDAEKFILSRIKLNKLERVVRVA